MTYTKLTLELKPAELELITYALNHGLTRYDFAEKCTPADSDPYALIEALTQLREQLEKQQ